MKEITRLNEINLNDIEVDSYWNAGQEKERKIHKIHAYPAKFPAFITQKALDYAKSQNINVTTIADIFCGCGTVAYEAKRSNINFWGCDINPVAVLIAKVKSNYYFIDKLQSYMNTIIKEFDGLIGVYVTKKAINNRIAYWFSNETIRELSLIKECILRVIPYESEYREFFLCAFSNILKPTSLWLTKSIKPQVDPNKVPANVRSAFIKQCEYMLKAISEESLVGQSKVTIERKNALEIMDKEVSDIIITSPPYVTSYEYADLHQLSSLWLDYAEDYRELRLESVGSNHNKFDLDTTLQQLNGSGRAIVTELMCEDKSKAKSVAKYFVDMQNISSICYNMLRKRGMIVFVIGNTEYKGVHIDNAKHLSEALLNSGFDRLYVTKRKITNKILTPYRNEKGRFSSDSSSRKVYHEEYIVIGRK